LQHPFFTRYLNNEHDQQGNIIDKEALLRLERFRQPTPFQQEVLNFLVKNLDEAEVESLRHTFTALDTDRSGFLSFQKLQEAFQQLGIPVDMVKLMQNTALAQDGRINYSQFLTACISKKNLFDAKRLQFAFCHYDSDNSGKICASDMKEAL